MTTLQDIIDRLVGNKGTGPALDDADVGVEDTEDKVELILDQDPGPADQVAVPPLAPAPGDDERLVPNLDPPLVAGTTPAKPKRSRSKGQPLVTEDIPPAELVYPAEWIADPVRGQEVADLLSRMPYISVDSETTGLDPVLDRLVLLQLGVPGQVWVIDLLAVPLSIFKDVLEKGPTKVGDNLMFEWMFLYQRGIVLWPIWDVMGADRLTTTWNYQQVPGEFKPDGKQRYAYIDRGMADIVYRVIGATVDKTPQTSDWTRRPLTQAQFNYAANDAAWPLKLYDRLLPQIQRFRQEGTLDLEHRALPYVAYQQYCGTPFDPDAWSLQIKNAADQGKDFVKQLDLLWADYGIDLKVSWSAPQQVLRAFQALGLQVDGELLKSTDAGELAVMENPPELVKTYQRYVKVKTLSTKTSFSKLFNDRRQCLVPGWWVHGTVTARITAVQPAVQTIPVEDGCRECVRELPPWTLVSKDFSQIELRVLAQVSQDTRMLDIFRQSGDIHALSARRMFRVPDGEPVSKTQRDIAKMVNFATIYGAGAKNLHRQIKVKLPEAEIKEADVKRFLREFDQLYPGAKAWKDSQAMNSSVCTLGGRVIRWPRGEQPPRNDLINYPIQATASDIFKEALARLWEDRDAPGVTGWKPALLIHDQIVMACLESQAEAVQEWLERHMLAAARQYLPDVPVVVEGSISPNYTGKPA
jgi:DNA polymerase-1